MKTVRKGDIIEIEIDSLGFGGQGVGRYHELVVFVDEAIPGQKVSCKIFKRKNNFAEAYIQEIQMQSPFYLPPVCKHFLNCGGCMLQHLSYAVQLSEKKSQIKEILTRIGRFSNINPLPPLASPDIYNYRNKMEFSFSPVRWLSQDEIKSDSIINQKGLFLGLHAKRFYEKVVDLEECHLCQPIVIQILHTVRELARKSGLPSFTTLDQTGFWRFLVVRPSVLTGDIMVSIIAYDYDDAMVKTLKNNILNKHPDITSLYYGITQSKANIAYCEKEILLAGQKTIEEKIGDFTFEISSQSFFQSNTKGAKQLYDVVKDYAMLQGHEIVYDLYCGAGTISIYCSSFAKRIIGFEAIPSAIQDAHNNCIKNKITNCDFILGDVRDQISDSQKLVSLYGMPDVMIIDPPRGGMHPKSIEAILEIEPERIVYVSCNPATLARDIKILCEEKYVLTKIQPVDMFPHTAHIEVVTQLHRK